MRYKDLVENFVENLESEIIDMLSALNAEGIKEIDTDNLLADLVAENVPIDKEELLEFLSKLDIVSTADENTIVLTDEGEEGDMGFADFEGEGGDFEMGDESDFEEPEGEDDGGMPPEGDAEEEVDTLEMDPEADEEDQSIDDRIDVLKKPASRVDALAKKKSLGDLGGQPRKVRGDI